MLNTRQEAKRLEDTSVQIAQCPLCESVTIHMYYMQDGKTGAKTKWYACHCGIVWQIPYPNFAFDKKWLDQQVSGPKVDTANKYFVKLIAPTIESLIYGRKLLMIGHNEAQLKEFRLRGWVSYSIDKNTHYQTSERLIASDFETFTFPEDLKFNLIWMYHSLNHLHNPFDAIKKATSLLVEDGILFLGTPDTDFIYTRSPSGFFHWKKENHILWNKRSLSTYLEKLGYDVISARKNWEQRFPQTDDCWIIAQKKFF